MQPPRVRRGKNPRTKSRLLLLAGINLGAGFLTIILLRLTLLLASVPTTVGFTHTLLRFTDPIVWPLKRIAMLDAPLLGAASRADILTSVILVVLLSVLLGTIAGWEQEGYRGRRSA